MVYNDIINCLDLLHRRVLHSRFAEDVTEAEILSLVEVIDLIKHQKSDIEKLTETLKYYLDTNEENGVVYIPKFVVEKRLKEINQ